MSKYRKSNSKQCCNCIVCVQDTELCPLSENYNENAYLEIEARLKANKEQRKQQRDKSK